MPSAPMTTDFNTSLVSVDMYKGFRQYFDSYLDKISEKIILKNRVAVLEVLL